MTKEGLAHLYQVRLDLAEKLLEVTKDILTASQENKIDRVLEQLNKRSQIFQSLTEAGNKIKDLEQNTSTQSILIDQTANILREINNLDSQVVSRLYLLQKAIGTELRMVACKRQLPQSLRNLVNIRATYFDRKG